MANNLTDYDKILEEQRKKLADTKKTQQDAINKTHDSQVTILNDQYGQVIDDTNVAYENEYQKNAVQKLINEKKIAEKNANLGLTDSGLNRTQQTAAQLSYANQKGNIDIAKRNALDTLSQNLASSLASIEQSRVTSLANLDTSIESQAQSSAYNIYKANVDANAAVQKAAIEASGKAALNTSPQKIYWFRGVSDQNDNYLYYNTETGKTEEVPPYMNPYTSNDNRIAYSAEYKDKNIGFFELANGATGYQPRGLKNEGGRFAPATAGGQVIKYDLYNNGKNNTVWESKTGKYFIWDDINNRYLDLTNQITALFPDID